jgi:hypothetical protein
MKQSILTIVILCIALIFTGGILRNWIPLSIHWQHDVGMISFYLGLFGLVKIIITSIRSNIEK